MQSVESVSNRRRHRIGQFIVSGRFDYAGFFDPSCTTLSILGQCQTNYHGRRVVQVHGVRDSPVFLFSQNPTSRTDSQTALYDIEMSTMFASYETTGGPADVTFKLGALYSDPVFFAGTEDVCSFNCQSGERLFLMRQLNMTRVADILCGTGCLLDQQLFALGTNRRLARIDACCAKLLSSHYMCEPGESRRLALDEERQLLFCSSWNSTVSFWSLTEEKQIESLSLGDWGDGILYHDNCLLVGLDYGIIQAWDVRNTKSCFAKVKMPGRFVNDFRAVFEKNHRYVIAGADGGGLVRVDTKRWTFETFSSLPGHVMSICLIRDTPDEYLDLRDEYLNERLAFLLGGIDVELFFADLRLTSGSFRVFRSLVRN